MYIIRGEHRAHLGEILSPLPLPTDYSPVSEHLRATSVGKAAGRQRAWMVSVSSLKNLYSLLGLQHKIKGAEFQAARSVCTASTDEQL